MDEVLRQGLGFRVWGMAYTCKGLVRFEEGSLNLKGSIRDLVNVGTWLSYNPQIVGFM